MPLVHISMEAELKQKVFEKAKKLNISFSAYCRMVLSEKLNEGEANK